MGASRGSGRSTRARDIVGADVQLEPIRANADLLDDSDSLTATLVAGQTPTIKVIVPSFAPGQFGEKTVDALMRDLLAAENAFAHGLKSPLPVLDVADLVAPLEFLDWVMDPKAAMEARANLEESLPGWIDRHGLATARRMWKRQGVMIVALYLWTGLVARIREIRSIVGP